MRRLLAAARCDARLQLRNGFYQAAAFVVGVWWLLTFRVRGVDWGPLLPALVLGNLTIGTFYFVGGLVLLERAERSLEALVVTPLRGGEYLGAKVLALVALGVAESLLVARLVGGRGFAVLPFAAGTALAGAIFTLAGFVAVVRYHSINEFLFPSVAYTGALLLPLFPLFGVAEGAWVYLHPVQAPLSLLQAAFGPVPAGELAYGAAASAAWVFIFWAAARRAFARRVAAAAGGGE